MENYDTIFENLMSFFFDIVNYDNTRFLILKYSTYDRFPNSLIESIKQDDAWLSILQSSDSKEIKIKRLAELKNDRTSEDVIMLDIHKAGVVIRDAILELATLQQDIAFRKVQFIESYLNSIDSLDLNPADPANSFKTFFTNCNNLAFKYIGPDYSSIDKLKITPNLIDDIIEDIITRIGVIDKIKAGLNRSFSIDSIQTPNLGISRISEKRLNRFSAGSLPGELPLITWYEINSTSSSNTQASIPPPTNNNSSYFENDFLNTAGQSIISKLKTEYKNAHVNRIKDMLYALTELKCTDSTNFDPPNRAAGANTINIKMSALVASLNKIFDKQKPLYNAVTIPSRVTQKNSQYSTEKQLIENMLSTKAL
ncbi:hypothetical protein [Mucilaginibacter sp. NFR10]|uniref:hypothetical protein n=1 Tax=Mucilaginibacter sp. NFR10 TaxID=1566292 RepID=UPI0008711AE5|nr:hypothetical protein [Mucilaginibacter sp. NFR10]SCW88420.1 hypothetical protein SAMN03159284_05388 [Mucilaginibacter sp. NFR10]